MSSGDPCDRDTAQATKKKGENVWKFDSTLCLRVTVLDLVVHSCFFDDLAFLLSFCILFLFRVMNTLTFVLTKCRANAGRFLPGGDVTNPIRSMNSSFVDNTDYQSFQGYPLASKDLNQAYSSLNFNQSYGFDYSR